MPKTARRNSLFLFGLLLIPHTVALFFRGSLNDLPIRPSFQARCGGDAFLWLLACSTAVSLAFLATAGQLLFTIAKRPKGHPLNGISRSYALRDTTLAAAFLAPWLNLQSAPCWLTPVFYSLVTVACGIVALHTTRRVPDLIRVPDFELQRLVRAGETHLARTEQAEAKPTTAELLLKEILENLKATREEVEPGGKMR